MRITGTILTVSLAGLLLTGCASPAGTLHLGTDTDKEAIAFTNTLVHVSAKQWAELERGLEAAEPQEELDEGLWIEARVEEDGGAILRPILIEDSKTYTTAWGMDVLTDRAGALSYRLCNEIPTGVDVVFDYKNSDRRCLAAVIWDSRLGRSRWDCTPTDKCSGSCELVKRWEGDLNTPGGRVIKLRCKCN